MPSVKHMILVSSGYQPSTLTALRKHWSVVDIANPEEALAYLRQCSDRTRLAHGVASDAA